MAKGGIHPVRLYDSDGDPLDDGGGRLNVNAVLSASDNIEIGNVDIKLNGTGVSAGSDPMDNGTIRVALATNDTQFGEIGDDPAVDGNIHEQLRYIGNALASQSTIASNTGGAKDALNWAVSTTGGQYAEGDGGFLATGVRNDTLESLVSFDHDHAPFQVNASGALYVEVASSATLSVNSHAVTNAGTFAVQSAVTSIIPGVGATNLGKEQHTQFTSGDVGVMPLAVRKDGIPINLTGSSTDYAPLQVNEHGALWGELVCGDAPLGQLEDTVHANGDPGIMALGVRKDVTEALCPNNQYHPFIINPSGAVYTTHGITGGGQGIKVTTGAGDHIVLGGDVACSKIDIQAQTDNTGLIAVGFTSVDATEATGDGIILRAGDTYSLEINNLNLIYIDSTVTGEGVRYTYFT